MSGVCYKPQWSNNKQTTVLVLFCAPRLCFARFLSSEIFRFLLCSRCWFIGRQKCLNQADEIKVVFHTEFWKASLSMGCLNKYCMWGLIFLHCGISGVFLKLGVFRSPVEEGEERWRKEGTWEANYLRHFLDTDDGGSALHPLKSQKVKTSGTFPQSFIRPANRVSLHWEV